MFGNCVGIVLAMLGNCLYIGWGLLGVCVGDCVRTAVDCLEIVGVMFGYCLGTVLFFGCLGRTGSPVKMHSNPHRQVREQGSDFSGRLAWCRTARKMLRYINLIYMALTFSDRLA